MRAGQLRRIFLSRIRAVVSYSLRIAWAKLTIRYDRCIYYLCVYHLLYKHCFRGHLSRTIDLLIFQVIIPSYLSIQIKQVLQLPSADIRLSGLALTQPLFSTMPTPRVAHITTVPGKRRTVQLKSDSGEIMDILPSCARSWIRRPRYDTLNLDDADPKALSYTHAKLPLFLARNSFRRALTTLLVIVSLCGAIASTCRIGRCARNPPRTVWSGEPF